MPVGFQIVVAVCSITAPDVILVVAKVVVAAGVRQGQLQVASVPTANGHRGVFRTREPTSLLRNRMVAHSVVAMLGIAVVNGLVACGQLSLCLALIPFADYTFIRSLCVQNLCIAVIGFAEKATQCLFFFTFVPVWIGGLCTGSIYISGADQIREAAHCFIVTFHGAVGGIRIALCIRRT